MTRFNCSVSFVIALLLVQAASAHPRACYDVSRVDAHPAGKVPLFATDLNDEGVVVGLTNPGIVEGRHAFKWKNGHYTDLHDRIDPNASRTEATAINDRSQIIGQYVDAVGTFHNFLLRRGEAVLIETAPGSNQSAVTDINNRTEITGLTFDFGQAQGYIWRRGEITLLPPLDGSIFQVTQINIRGDVVGTGIQNPGRLRPVLWQDGQVIDLGVLPGFFDSRGFAINDRRQVVGQLEGGSPTQGFLWEDGTMLQLPLLEGGQFVNPSSINNAGEIVGRTSAGARSMATLWTDELVPIDLNTVICAHDRLRSRVTLELARVINNRGQILAMGHDARFPDQPSWFLLTPKHRAHASGKGDAQDPTS